MNSISEWLFGSVAFAPHGYCLLWEPNLIAMHAVSDLVIALSYFTIPIGIIYFLRRKQQLEYGWVFGLFALFIVFCGLTHIVGMLTLWYPAYGFQGVVKVTTAIVSAATAYAIWPIMPQAIALPTPAQLRRVNDELEVRIRDNTRINAELAAARDELETRVRARTADLVRANAMIADREARIAEAYRRTPVMMASTDMNGVLLDVSDAWVDSMGHPREDVLGRSIYAHLSMESKQFVRRRDWSGFMASGSLERLPLSFMRKDGTTFECEVSAVLLDDGVTGERRVLVVAVDMTERNRALRELETKARDMMRANESLEQFAYIASHDLQEPLRKIVLYSDMMLEGLENGRDDDVRYASGVIRDGAVRARALVSDLLAYSRAANKAIVPAEIPLDQALADARQVLSTRIEESGATLLVEGPAVVLRGDRLQFGQLLQNLLSNALKYAAPGRLPVITVRTAIDARRKLTISIEDNGIGFKNEHAQKIFEPFTRLHTRSQYPGTGIGLAICRAVCERHGWRIAATGRPDEGATITVTVAREGYALAPKAG